MRLCLTTIPLILLAACAVGPNYKGPPTVKAADAWTEPGSTVAVDIAWWKTLGDPVLTELVLAAMNHNLDLRSADASLLEARANRVSTASALFPKLDANGSVTRNEASNNGEFPLASIPGISRRYGLLDVGFDASWEIDFWGRNQRSVEAADARIGSLEESRRDTLMQVIAEVVRSYIDLRSAQAKFVSSTHDAEARSRTAALTKMRFQAGDASRFDMARAQSQSLSSQSEIAGYRADAHAAGYSLALLTGRPPEASAALVDNPAPLPAAPAVFAVGVGLRSDLLRRRPDVRKAERDLAAATADIGAATADLFPRITLTGSFGQQSQAGNTLFSTLSSRYQIGPSLSWPVFDAGRIRAQIHAADARADQAGARYEKAVLTAFADSETALNRYAASANQRHDRDASQAQSAKALDLAQRRYRAGDDDLQAVLDSQLDYSSTERSALNARATELTNLVSLYKALGGGWEAADASKP